MYINILTHKDGNKLGKRKANKQLQEVTSFYTRFNDYLHSAKGYEDNKNNYRHSLRKNINPVVIPSGIKCGCSTIISGLVNQDITKRIDIHTPPMEVDSVYASLYDWMQYQSSEHKSTSILVEDGEILDLMQSNDSWKDDASILEMKYSSKYTSPTTVERCTIDENIVALKQDTIRLRYNDTTYSEPLKCTVISKLLVKNNEDEIFRIEKLINNIKDKRIINEK